GNAAQTLQAGAAQQTVEDRLGLIGGGVSGGDEAEAMLTRHPGQPVVTHSPCCLLEVPPLRCRNRGDVDPLAAKAKGRGARGDQGRVKFANEGFVAIALATAQAVIEM